MGRITTLMQAVLNISASLKGFGVHLIRVAIFIIFIWIGGLKFWNYEAEGIVPFVANSPFMSFFYEKEAPEYKDYKLKEGEFDKVKHEWHQENNTWFGIADHVLWNLDALRHLVPENWLCWNRSRHINDLWNTFVSRHNPRVLGARFRQW